VIALHLPPEGAPVVLEDPDWPTPVIARVLGIPHERLTSDRFTGAKRPLTVHHPDLPGEWTVSLGQRRPLLVLAPGGLTKVELFYLGFVLELECFRRSLEARPNRKELANDARN
jgi:hypothetical protein